MRFTVKKDVLKQALDVIGLAVTNDSGVITSAILFRYENDEMVLWATDRRVVVKVPMNLEDAQGTGLFTVEYSRLVQWVNSVKDGDIEFNHEANDVTLTCGKFTGHFASLDPSSFPDFEPRLRNSKKLFEANPTSFVEALKFIRPYIGDGTSNNATANNFQITELLGNCLFATDSFVLSRHKLASFDLTDYTTNGDSDRFKVTKDEIRKLITFLSKTCTDKCLVSKGDLFVVESDDGSMFAYPNTHYSLSMLEKMNLDLDPPEVWTVNRTALQSAVSALVATANPDDTTLMMKAEGEEGSEGTLTLMMKDATAKHDSVVEIPLVRNKVSQAILEAKINHKFFTKPLSSLGKDDVEIGVNAVDANKYVRYLEELPTGDSQMCVVTFKI